LNILINAVVKVADAVSFATANRRAKKVGAPEWEGPPFREREEEGIHLINLDMALNSSVPAS